MRVGISLLQDVFNTQGGWVAGFYYVRNCINALATLPTNEVPEVLVFVPESFDTPLLLPEYQNTTSWLRVVHVPDRLLTERTASVELQRLIDQHPVDILFPVMVPPIVAFKAHMVGWIPDYQHRWLPQFFQADDLEMREQLFNFLMGFCDQIICSSRAVYDDMHRFYPHAKGKGVILNFVSLIASQIYALPPDETLHQLGITGKYIYLPNQFWVHKNHRLVFEAWKLLAAEGHHYPLICTGWSQDYRAPDYHQQLKQYLQQHQLEEMVKLLGFIDRNDQIQLYRGAAAILQPSLFEGWSTSIEDAKAFGKLVIASDFPVHHEQLGENGIFFQRDSAEDLAQVILTHWSKLDDGYNQAREQAAAKQTQERAQQFGRQLLQTLQDALQDISPEISCTRALMLPMIARINRLQISAINDNQRIGDDLRQHLNDAEADRQARGALISELEQQLQTALAEGEARHDLLARLQGQLDERLALIEQLTSQNQEAEADRQARGELITNLEQQLQTALAEGEARLDLLARLQGQLDERLALIEQLTAQSQEAEADRLARGEVIADLEQQFHLALTESNTRLTMIEQLTAQIQQIQEEHSQAIAYLQHQLGERLALIQQLDTHFQELKAEDTVLRHEIERLSSESADRLEQIECLSSESADRLEQIERLDALLHEMEQTLSDHQTELAQRCAQIEQLELQLRAAQTEAATSRQEFDGTIATRDATIAQLHDQLQTVDSDRNARLAVIMRFEAQLAASEADRATRLETISELHRRLNASEADRAARLRAIEYLQRILRSYEAEQKILNRRLIRLLRRLRLV